MTTPKVLVVDDDKMTRDTLSMGLSDTYNTISARNGSEALSILTENDIDLVLSDLDMPGMSGIELLKEIKGMDSKLPVIFITGKGTIETAVEAMKLGACDYVTKPVNFDRLILLINKSLENKKLKEENLRLKEKIRESYPVGKFIGSSEAMKKCEELALQVADTTASVLIEGESGTGKELLTNIIHYNSSRANGPFIKVNCSAFAEGVLESELFGHEKGAFTGAVSAKKGRFELADGGTLLLDEIGELPHSIQVKLLRFLQEKSFERVGGTKTLQVDVRIISSTNKDLAAMVSEGTFREDLYYRLRVVQIVMPPLRDRKEDLEELVYSFIAKFSELHGKPIKGISGETMDLIRAYNWPGNVRELMNCIESAVVMNKGDMITVEDIPEFMSYKIPEVEVNTDEGLLQEVERKTIRDTLKSTGGDKVKTARILGIGLRTLYRKIEKWNLG
ncbi:MAG: sigma-54-dependent transcriptional regulator [Desulfurivibrionaceae bacterium]